MFKATSATINRPTGPSSTFTAGYFITVCMIQPAPNRNTDINVYNTTRYKRRVKFYSENLDIVTKDLAPGGKVTLRAASYPGRWVFNGVAGFKVKRHESIKL
jgi:hypothetical protein